MHRGVIFNVFVFIGLLAIQPARADSFEQLKEKHQCIYETPTFNDGPSGCWGLNIDRYNYYTKELRAKIVATELNKEAIEKEQARMRSVSRVYNLESYVRNLASYKKELNNSQQQYSQNLNRLADDLQNASYAYLSEAEQGIESRNKLQIFLNDLSRYPYMSDFRSLSSQDKAEALGQLEAQVRTAAVLSATPDCSPDVALKPNIYDLTEAESLNSYQYSQLMKCYKNLSEIRDPSPEQLMAQQRVTQEIGSVCVPYLAVSNSDPEKKLKQLETLHDQHTEKLFTKILRTAGIPVIVSTATNIAGKKAATIAAASAACGYLSKLAQRWTSLKSSTQKASSWLLQKRPFALLRPALSSTSGAALRQSTQALSQVWRAAKPGLGGPFTVFVSIAISPDPLGCKGCDDAMGIAFMRQREEAENFYMKALPDTCNLYERNLRSYP